MTDKKTIFVAFAMEDESRRNLFTGQRIHPDSPFEFIDLSVKEQYVTDWKDRVRTRIRRSQGVIALISKSTPGATGQLWEITCAREEGKPLLGIWLDEDYRVKPAAMGSAPCKTWTWDNVANFIDSV
ncbi:TIR domain-containing protein [Streptomyces lavendulocolor]|uniref:TIR domain-containing protein n=1 Tax=Streptomyces lavendulocolor TaxID=67316 RepID=UPI003C2DE762